MRSRSLVAILSAALIGGALGGIPNRHEGNGAMVRPNVLLVVIDTLRADHLGSYGYPRQTSPSIDRLAAAGMRFVIARAPSSWTGASVASLLTGMSPIEHGLEYHDSFLTDAHLTMPEAFAAADYETVAFSANPAFVTPKVGLAQGFERFDVLHGKEVGAEDGTDLTWTDRAMKRFVEVATADQVTDRVLGWLRRRSPDTRPFFAYVHYFDPHAGYYPPPAYADRFGVPRNSRLRGRAQRNFVYYRMKDIGDITPADLATLIDLYDAEIAFTDAHLGRLLIELAAQRVGPTVIVVTSDHGEEFGEHGGLQHSRTLFGEVLRVPLIMSGFGVPRGTIVETPVSLLDVWPLLADLTGVAAAPHLRTQSLRALTTGKTPGPTQPFFASLAGSWGIHESAVVDAASKLILDPAQVASVYDLEHDPGETQNVARSIPRRTKALRALMRTHVAHARASRARTAPGRFVMTPERRAHLEALGYVE